MSDESESDDDMDEHVDMSMNGTERAYGVATPTRAKFPLDDESINADDIPMSDIESPEKEDIVPHRRLTINNTTALLTAHKTLTKNEFSQPFSARQTITSSTPVLIPDSNDDLNRDLAFYKQCLDAAMQARTLLKKEDVPFSRPSDYFAEMVKSDEHMGKIKQRIVDNAARRKASSEAKRQRELKKFGKQVQVATMQERAKEKRRMLEKVELLKKSTFTCAIFSLFLTLLHPGLL